MQRVCCPSRKLLYNTIGLLAIPMKQNAKFDLISITFPAKIATFLFFFPAHWTLFFLQMYTHAECVSTVKLGKKREFEAPVRCFAWRAGCCQVPHSPSYMARIEQKANMSLLMVGQTTRQSRFLEGLYYRAKSQNEFQHRGVWSVCLRGLISFYSGVLTMRLWQTSIGSHI